MLLHKSFLYMWQSALTDSRPIYSDFIDKLLGPPKTILVRAPKKLETTLGGIKQEWTDNKPAAHHLYPLSYKHKVTSRLRFVQSPGCWLEVSLKDVHPCLFLSPCDVFNLRAVVLF